MNIDASQPNRLQESFALSVFRAWLWVPHARVRLRGLATVQLAVFPRRLVVTPRWQIDQLNWALDIPARIDYTWPVAVIERLRPAGGAGVLLEVDGALGRASVGLADRGRLAEAVSAAGFEVVEVTHWGWEAPRAVGTAELRADEDQVPTCITAS